MTPLILAAALAFAPGSTFTGTVVHATRDIIWVRSDRDQVHIAIARTADMPKWPANTRVSCQVRDAQAVRCTFGERR